MPIKGLYFIIYFIEIYILPVRLIIPHYLYSSPFLKSLDQVLVVSLRFRVVYICRSLVVLWPFWAIG